MNISYVNDYVKSELKRRKIELTSGEIDVFL